jgi:hypothetical protein
MPSPAVIKNRLIWCHPNAFACRWRFGLQSGLLGSVRGALSNERPYRILYDYLADTFC